MKRGQMRNAPKIDLPAALGQADKTQPTHAAAPAVNTLRESVKNMTGHNITLPVCGRDVVFTLKTVPAKHVERVTLVWNENERLQELLNEDALDDLIPSFESNGQQNPAFGRSVNGVVEIADGSRRRMTAIITGKEYRVLVGDLDDEQMAWLSQVGNDYRQTSAYERGRRYARKLENNYAGNVSALAEAEKISRKIIMRCINTAELPMEIIKLFANPTELSARAGEELHKVFEAHGEAMMERVSELQQFKNAGEKLDTDLIISALKGAAGKPAKPEETVRNFGPGVSARYKGDSVTLSLRGADPALVRRIEMILEAAEKPGVSSEVDELISKLEGVVGSK